MVVILYRSDCYLFRGDWPIVSWSQWSFEPISGGEELTESGLRKFRDTPLSFPVRLPPLARRDGDRVFESGDK